MKKALFLAKPSRQYTSHIDTCIIRIGSIFKKVTCLVDGYQLFKDMKYSVPDLSSGDPGTLCQLDIQVYFHVNTG